VTEFDSTGYHPPPQLRDVVRLGSSPPGGRCRCTGSGTGSLVVDLVDRPVGAVLTELREEVAPSQTAAGGGGSGRAAAASLDVLDVLDQVTGTVQEWLALVGLRERRATDRDRVEDGLRRLAVHHWSGDHVRRDQLARILNRQRLQAERVLTGDTSVYIRDTRCPECHAAHVQEADGSVHRPLRLVRARSETPDGRPGPVDRVQCTACPAWWPWSDVADEHGAFRVALADDQAEYDAERGRQAAQEAARRAEEDRRAALYDDTAGSARRLGATCAVPGVRHAGAPAATCAGTTPRPTGSRACDPPRPTPPAAPAARPRSGRSGTGWRSRAAALSATSLPGSTARPRRPALPHRSGKSGASPDGLPVSLTQRSPAAAARKWSSWAGVAVTTAAVHQGPPTDADRRPGSVGICR
jgi:hypothetical protein